MDQTHIAIVGDTHGHLQLALCVIAEWQKLLGISFEAVFLSGDVGTFTNESQLDSATRAHAKTNPMELEFLKMWASEPQAPYLKYIFKPESENGLGLTCPVLMVHGNHEGFHSLETLFSPAIPDEHLDVAGFSSVDTGGFIKYLPSGWKVKLGSGVVVAGIGGVERNQRSAKYHPMAFIDDEAVLSLLDGGQVDILITHQGPLGIQGDHGSETLQLLLDAGVSKLWFHSHSVKDDTIQTTRNGTTVVPLGDIAFPAKGLNRHEPGSEGWAYASFSGDEVTVIREEPPCLSDFRKYKWQENKDDTYVSPTLIQAYWNERKGG